MTDRTDIPAAAESGNHPTESFNYVHRLRLQLKKESSTCWLLVTIAALLSYPIGSIAAQMAMAFLAMIGVALDQLVPESLSGGVTGLTLLSNIGVSLLSLLIAVSFPVLIAAGSWVAYNRAYKLAIRDLVWGNMGLMLADEQYARVIEDVKQERFHPSIYPVTLTPEISGKVRHFAYYYPYFYRMSFGPVPLKIPILFGGNCWFDGGVLVASCCVSCFPFSIWFMVRTAIMWPRVLGLQRGVYEFLEGRYDALLESQYLKRERL